MKKQAVSAALLLIFSLSPIVGWGQTTKYWDAAAGSGNGVGGSTTWGTTFSTSSTGDASLTTCAPSDDAVFEGTAGTVTLDANQTASSLTFNTTEYSITTNSGTTRVLTGGISLANNVNLNLFTPGNGALTLSSISGGTSSTLTITGSNSSSTDAIRINLASGATIAGSTPIVISTSGTLGISGIVSSLGTSTISSTITNNSSIPTMLGATGSFTLNVGGVVSGSAGVQFSASASGGAGDVTISAAGSWTGNTQFNGSSTGSVKLGINNGLSTSSNIIMGFSSGNGQIFDLRGYDQTILSLTSNSGGSGSITNTGAGVSTSTLTINGTASSGSFGLIISDGNSKKTALVRSGTGTTTLTAASTYTGSTTINGGTLIFNRPGGATIPITNNCTVTGGILQISSNQTLNNVTLTGGTIVIDDGVTLTINGSFTRNNGTTINLNSTGSLQYGASSILTYSGSSSQTASTSEFPSSNGPNSLTINNSTGVIFPSSFDRTINGTLTFTSGKLTLGTSNLILANGSTVSGASSSNYIVTNSTGYLQRNSVTSSTNFPVGNSTYNPINIVNSGTADNFTVNVSDDVLDAGTSGTALTANAVDRTWTVTEGTGGGSNVMLTVQWNASDELGSFTRSSCYLSHYNGGWDATTAGAASGGNPYTISRSGITTFSPFGVGSGGALPVSLINLKAQKINKTSLITWATATELNNDYFSIERKTPISEYEIIGTVKGAGNSNTLLNYSFIDNNPVANSLNYYRIVQHDFNGVKETFGPVSLRFGNLISEVTLSPNPFDNSITLTIDDESVINKIAVTNIVGELIFEQNIEVNSSITINTETWKPGNYFITLTGSHTIKIFRQVKF